jgi:hypothetical protein
MTRFKNMSKTKRIVAAGLTAGLTLGLASAAFAYFTSTGSGTGNATVGSAGTWTVATSAPTGGLLYPGVGTDTVAYTVTNSGSGYEELNGTTAALKTATGGGVYDTTTSAFVDGCQASWFTVINTTVTGDVAAAGDLSSNVTIALTDSGTNQDACESLTPQVIVSAS